jgi:flagellar biogenesis protein FliO
MFDSVLPMIVIFAGGPALLWWLRRGKSGPAAPLRIVGRTALTKSSVVAVVEADGRRFLLGASEQGISILSELAATSADTEVDDMAVVEPAQLVPFGPRMSPLETLRAMTARTPTHSRPRRGSHR